ncbi:hypothetical protein L6452_42659 [Arctium lappa]|uniref:Uncharacterized protein n=1 Tax=Arctium lappa TaxID=4217 RepID=A0ACB8XJM9_ARCLA|nr:hypothetical protein L6452_42659 [Arctium lappa]
MGSPTKGTNKESESPGISVKKDYVDKESKIPVPVGDTPVHKKTPTGSGMKSILRKLDRCSSINVKKDATGSQSNKPGERNNMNNKEMKIIPTINLVSDERRTTRSSSKRVTFQKKQIPYGKDTDAMELRLQGSSMKITENTVHENLGIPIGGLDLESITTENNKLTMLIYVDSTIWAEGDVDHKIIPLHAWNMEMLRRRLKARQHQEGLHIAKVVQARSSAPELADTETEEQIAEVGNQKVECSEPTQHEVLQHVDQAYEEPAVEYDNEYDEEELKKEYMEMIDKNFNLIYATKWDFGKPLREYTAQDDVHSSSDDEVENDAAMESDDETDKSDHQPIIVTPTKLDFSDNASLEDIQTLSQIWYNPTTYHLIDQAIVGKSAESSKQQTTSCHDTSESNAASKQPVPSEMRSHTHASDTPTPSFNLGISPLTSDLYKTGDTKGKEKLPNEECPPKPTIDVGPPPKECRTPSKQGFEGA